MNIYTMRSPLVGDDFFFKELHVSNPKWHQSPDGIRGRKNGDPIEVFWGTDSTEKPMGDMIMFVFYGLLSRNIIVNHFQKFAPDNTVNPIVIDGLSDEFSFLQPKNYSENSVGLEHMFLIFSKYKALLVTEEFKKEWERLNLKGAEFSFVCVMDEARFIKLN